MRVTRLPAPVADAAIAVAATAAILVAMSVGHEAYARPLDAAGYGLGLATGGVLLVRRRWPVTVLYLTYVLLAAYHVLGYSAFAPAVALVVPLYSAAAAGHVRPSVLAVVLVNLFILFYRAFVDIDTEQVLRVVVDLVGDAGFQIAATFLGAAVHSRRAWTAEVQERLRGEAERRVGEERLRIARELHDVMAHTVAVITVQAGVAADVLDDDPAAARSALQTIRAASREAMGELKAVVGVLRDGQAPTEPAPGLEQVDGLLDAARRAGLRVELAVGGSAHPLPAAVDLTAYRIVQESLTNVIRHAAASTATVTIGYEADGIALSVCDDGRGPDTAPAYQPGHGLAGMAERATAIGGWLKAGRGFPAGFLIEAWLPG